MADKDDIEYYFLKENDFDEVIAFYTDDFFHREPITLGTRADEKMDIAKGRMAEDIRRSLRSGICVGAKDRKTGKMVGGRISVIHDVNNPHKPTQPENEFKELYRILDYVLGQSFTVEKADKYLLMLLLSVHRDYGGRGIAGKLIVKCEEAAYAQGAQVSCTCITNVLSGKVFTKLGYETKFTLTYADQNDFQVDESRMYGNKTVRLMTRTLP